MLDQSTTAALRTAASQDLASQDLSSPTPASQTPALQRVVAELLAALGPDVVTPASDFGSRRLLDWSGMRGATPIALLRPRSTQQVSEALAVCHALGQSVVTQGGLTGLAGGANAQGGEVALSLERMHAIEEIDTVSGTLTVQAGAILQRVQEAADAAGMLFALDLGARGSCTIGGNLATNAGGNRVIKYGMARELVVGLEVVLADGTIISDMHKMIKNNSGYDLKHLMIGSEGTLGVITRAVMRLLPKPAGVATAWCGLPDFAAVTRLLAHAQARCAGGVSAFEVMWPSYVDFVIDSVPGVRAPLDTRHAYYVLLESVGSDAGRHAEEFETMLGEMLEQGVVENAALATSVADANAFWAVRDAPAEFPVLLPQLIGFDISFPIADVGAFAAQCESMLHERWPGIRTLVYGHLGDGNLHLIAHIHDAPDGFPEAVDAAVYALTRDWRGAVSAEHGIGAKKRAYLPYTRDAGAIAAMRAIKRALDPGNLLNPGKIFPADA
ncbi:MAG: FAD-binding oxidoreductase [Janthinobacterium lividum]